MSNHAPIEASRRRYEMCPADSASKMSNRFRKPGHRRQANHRRAIVDVMAIELELDDDDRRILRGALLAARASELAEMHRRGFRHSYGKSSDSARASMGDEVAHHQRRIELLDRLIEHLREG